MTILSGSFLAIREWFHRVPLDEPSYVQYDHGYNRGSVRKFFFVPSRPFWRLICGICVFCFTDDDVQYICSGTTVVGADFDVLMFYVWLVACRRRVGSGGCIQGAG